VIVATFCEIQDCQLPVDGTSFSSMVCPFMLVVYVQPPVLDATRAQTWYCPEDNSTLYSSHSPVVVQPTLKPPLSLSAGSISTSLSL